MTNLPAFPPITSHSLSAHPVGETIAAILQAALHAVDPALSVHAHLRREGSTLYVGERAYHLAACRRVLLIAVGKAAAPMARAATDILGDFLTTGILVTKDGHVGAQDRTDARLTIFESGHPVPDARGVTAAREVMRLLENGAPDDLVLFLISGGGSALLTLPAAPLELSDLQTLTRLLLASGATINELNTLRKHLDRIKGGGLARQASPARLCALILSDVIGSPLEVIASGPTAADPSTFVDAMAILEHRGLLERTPPAILNRLRAGVAGDIPETPKPGDALFQNVQNLVIADLKQALQAAAARASALGARVEILADDLQGEARQVGQQIVSEIHARLSDPSKARPLCLLAGGETTVTLRGDGLGGRNQELALSMVDGLSQLTGVLVVTLASDGGDGPTDAAGAVVSGSTRARALLLGREPQDYLDSNDAYHFFQPLGDLLITGPTQTNVNDLLLVWID